MDYPKSNPAIRLHNGKFTDGSADGTVKPSLDPAEWNNAVTDELLAVIVAGGGVPDETNVHQVRDAIQTMIANAVGAISVKQKSIVVTGATFAAGVINGSPVRWDAGAGNWAKALADGSANDIGLGIADVTNSEVVLYGETRAGLVSGLAPGSRYYLSATGALATAPEADAIQIGVAKSATVIFIDIDRIPPAWRGCRVRKSVAQSIPHSTITPLTWDVEDIDTNGFHVASPASRMTVPAGVSKVRLRANVVFDPNATGQRQAFFAKNGAMVQFAGTGDTLMNANTSGQTYVNITSATFDVVAGDYFEVVATQTSGGALNVPANMPQCWFEMEVVS